MNKVTYRLFTGLEIKIGHWFVTVNDELADGLPGTSDIGHCYAMALQAVTSKWSCTFECNSDTLYNMLDMAISDGNSVRQVDSLFNSDGEDAEIKIAGHTMKVKRWTVTKSYSPTDVFELKASYK